MMVIEPGETPTRILNWKPRGPTSFIRHIQPRSHDDRFPLPLWETWFCQSLGVPIPDWVLLLLNRYLVGPITKWTVPYCKIWYAIFLSTCLCCGDDIHYQFADLFRTTHKVKTQQVVKNRGQYCGDIELAGYLANAAGPVPLVLESLNDTAADKIRKYRADYNNNPNAISFMPAIASTSGRLHSEFIRILFLQVHRETDRLFAGSGVQSVQSNMGEFFHFRRAAFSSMLKSRVSSILVKAADLRINLNLDGASITSKSHTHPSYSQTSRLLTSSLSLGVPVPRPTQCMRGVWIP